MSKLEKMGALWFRRSKNGTDFFSGKIGEQNVIVFKVKQKRSEKSPDFEIFKSEPREKEATNEYQW